MPEDGHFERSHAYTGGLDSKVSVADCQEIQPDAEFRITCIRCPNSVERPIQTAYGIAEQKIDASLVLERIAKVGTLQLVPRDGFTAGRSMQALVLISDELFELGG